MAQKLIDCKACGDKISSSAKTCPHCGAKNSKPIFKKWWFWAIIIVAFISIVSSTSSDSPDTNNSGNVDNNQSISNTVSSNVKNDAFSGDCGISAVAEMGTDIIGQPTVTVSITNTTEKDILAIKFYAVPLDVYGEELKGVFTQNKLSTDDSISAGDSTSCYWQLLDNEVKTIKLYVYSVYFEDGTEWGDKEAAKTTILKKGLAVEVSGKSGE